MRDYADKSGADVAAMVVPHMDGWEIVPGEGDTLENKARGLRVWFAANEYSIPAGRVRIQGVMPQRIDGFHWHFVYRNGETRPSLEITCAIRRGGAAIARDIERRLLGEYETAMERVRPAIREYKAVRQLQEDTVRFFEDAFRTERIGHRPNIVPSHSKLNGRWEAHLSSGSVGRLVFEGLDIETAAHLIQIYEETVGAEPTSK